LLYKQIRKDSAMNRVGMPDYMLFFRKDAPNDRAISHCAPGDRKEATKIAREWLTDLRRQGLCASVPDDALLEHLIDEAQFDVMEWQKLASPVWMDIQQGEVLSNFRRAKAANDEKHVCPLQLGVIRRCLRLYTRPGDVVMDPFNGIGSTGYEAVRQGRKYLGFELKKEYAAHANANLLDAEKSAMDLFNMAAE
jgi:hypothetical protein